MEDLDRQLQGMKYDVTGLQVWNPDSTSYFQASGDDAYNYADGIDPYSYAGGEQLQGLFSKVGNFVKTNKDAIKTIGSVAGGLASAGAGSSKPCKGLFGGALKRKLGRCSDAPEPISSVAPEKSNTALYVGIGAGVILLGTIAFLVFRKK
jgi:hypothetical protein